MKFFGIRRVFSTENEEQYETIGASGMKCPIYMEERNLWVWAVIGLVILLNM